MEEGLRLSFHDSKQLQGISIIVTVIVIVIVIFSPVTASAVTATAMSNIIILFAWGVYGENPRLLETTRWSGNYMELAVLVLNEVPIKTKAVEFLRY